MHRHLRADFLIRERVEELRGARGFAAEEHDRPLATLSERASVSDITPKTIGCAAPDVLEALLPCHGAHRPAFPLDDGETHLLDGRIVGKIAITVKVADGIVDP